MLWFFTDDIELAGHEMDVVLHEQRLKSQERGGIRTTDRL